eukprot:TRINITY_DN8346_c0_g1_i1.p2 TRINITY_DN8346_c0_g1~~TRINITY_DN8346_c0_g1_i1.p2  ORF type:complete len:119 (+),score=56.63 TRINITY_DN8346_c0_g1_i1:58-414(+)
MMQMTRWVTLITAILFCAAVAAAAYLYDPNQAPVSVYGWLSEIRSPTDDEVLNIICALGTMSLVFIIAMLLGQFCCSTKKAKKEDEQGPLVDEVIRSEGKKHIWDGGIPPIATPARWP